MTASEAPDPGDDDAAAEAAALQRYGSALLRRAVGFGVAALDSLPPFDAEGLALPTPCAGWDLEMLLRHLDDSLAAMHEGVTMGTVMLMPPPEDRDRDLVESLRDGARRLLSAWTDADREGRVVMVAGSPVRAGVVAGAGALEMVVHAWDISESLGGCVRIPEELAERMLRIAPLLIPDHARQGLFKPPVEPPPGACAADRLVAFLGRDPTNPLGGYDDRCT